MVHRSVIRHLFCSTALHSPTVGEWLIMSLLPSTAILYFITFPDSQWMAHHIALACCLSSTVLCCLIVRDTTDVIISFMDPLHSSAYPVPNSREDIDEKLRVPSLIVGMISGKGIQLSCSRQSGRYWPETSMILMKVSCYSISNYWELLAHYIGISIQLSYFPQSGSWSCYSFTVS